MYEITLPILMVVTLGGILAAFAQRTSGFAFGVIVLSVLPYVLSYTDAVAVAKMGTAGMTVLFFLLNHKNFNWEIAKYPFFAMLVCDIIGILLAKQIGLENLKVFLGIFLIFVGGHTLCNPTLIAIQPTREKGILFGMLAGICSGFFGAGGPFLAMYASAIDWSKEEYFSTTQGLLSVVLSTDVIVRACSGLIRLQAVETIVVMLPGVALGAVLGTLLFRRIDEKLLRKVVNLMITVNGFLMVWVNLRS